MTTAEIMPYVIPSLTLAAAFIGGFASKVSAQAVKNNQLVDLKEAVEKGFSKFEKSLEKIEIFSATCQVERRAIEKDHDKRIIRLEVTGEND